MWILRFLTSVLTTIIVVLGIWAAFVLHGPHGRDVWAASRGKFKNYTPPTQ